MNTNKPTALVIKFGGSNAITPEGANLEYLRNYISQLKDELAKFDKVAFVIGGGIRCRMLQEKVSSADEKDKVGIQSTWDHANQLSQVITDLGFHPDAGIPDSPDQAKKFLEDSKYLAMGGLQIGQSTDAVSVFAASRFQKMGYQPTLIILSNVDAIYTADPNKDPNAKAIQRSSIHSLVKEKVLTNDPDDWKPGMSVTIDPVAVKILQGNGEKQTISVYFGHGDDVENTLKALQGQKTDRGTVLAPDMETVYYS